MDVTLATLLEYLVIHRFILLSLSIVLPINFITFL